MRISLPIFIMIPALLSAQEIASPQKRMASLDTARALLTTQPMIESAEKLEQGSPFVPKRSEPVIDSSPTPAAVVIVADRDRLAMLAPNVIPTGAVQLGSKAFLLFGQKKLKVGDLIPIVFQGATYELQISAIDRTTFTLRLNAEEVIRPIKPVVTKP